MVNYFFLFCVDCTLLMLLKWLFNYYLFNYWHMQRESIRTIHRLSNKPGKQWEIVRYVQSGMYMKLCFVQEVLNNEKQWNVFLLIKSQPVICKIPYKEKEIKYNYIFLFWNSQQDTIVHLQCWESTLFWDSGTCRFQEFFKTSVVSCPIKFVPSAPRINKILIF